LSGEVKIHCFWLITSKLTLPTSAYFWYGGHISWFVHSFISMFVISRFEN